VLHGRAARASAAEVRAARLAAGGAGDRCRDGVGRRRDSTGAKACQNGGWQNLVGANSSAFRNQGDCAAYAAQGGTLTAKSASQVSCESYGGTFSTDPASSYFDNPLATFLWSCNRGDLTFPNDAYLAAHCFHDDGGAFAWETVAAPWYLTCYA
jgi:hypothetical protein